MKKQFSLLMLSGIGLFICSCSKSTVADTTAQQPATTPTAPNTPEPTTALSTPQQAKSINGKQSQERSLALPTIDTFDNWATYLNSSSTGNETLQALDHLLKFYNGSIPGDVFKLNVTFDPEITGVLASQEKNGESWAIKRFDYTYKEFLTTGVIISTDVSQEGIFLGPSSRADANSLVYPIGTPVSLSISTDATAPNPLIKADLSGKVVMSGSMVILMKTEDGQCYLSTDKDGIIPVLKEKEHLASPTSDDKVALVLQEWRLLQYRAFLRRISNPPFSDPDTVTPEMCEFLSETPILESKSILLKMASASSSKSRSVATAALANWQKTFDIANSRQN